MKVAPHSDCRLNTKPVLHNEAVAQVQTLLDLLQAVLGGVPTAAEARSLAAYERHFLYCLAWGVGGLLGADDRCAFDQQLRKLAPAAMPQVCNHHLI